jgi:GNAT superfamily N-acetyltransferase
MVLQLRKTEDKDVEAIIKLQYAAFSNPYGIDKFISPSSRTEVTESSISDMVARYRDRMLNSGKESAFWVVYDTDLETVISTAVWEIYPEERTQEQVETLAQKPPPPPGCQPEAWDDFFGHLGIQRRKLGTRPIGIVRSISTHPDQQRRGAAKLLLERFVKEVDVAGVEAYIEASRMGKPLYARFGYEPVFEKVFDLEKYGGSGQDSNTVMIRPVSSTLK